MQIQFHDRSPIYRQLADRLREMILEGVYRNGDALPSVRQIASEHRINPITVSKSFQILVDDELVEKKRGLGMYVNDGAREQLLELERTRFLGEEIPAFAEKAKRLGISQEVILESLNERNERNEGNEP